MNKADFIGELEKHIKEKYRTKLAAAIDWGVTEPFICTVLKGRRQVPRWMAHELGYEPVKTITYTFEKREAPF